MDTSQLYVPKEQLESNNKLILDNDPVTLDDTIPTYSRTGKKAYREVQYKDEYTPQEFISPESVKKKVTFSDQKSDFKNDITKVQPIPKVQVNQSQPKKSERLRTKWKPTKIAQVMFATMNALLVSICVYAEPVKPLINFENFTISKQVRAHPLSNSEKEEKLRAYHAKLDLLIDMFLSDNDSYKWQVEHICCEVWGSAVGQSSTGCSCCWLLGSASKGKAKEMNSKGICN